MCQACTAPADPACHAAVWGLAQVQQEGCAALASLAGSLRLLELSHCRGLSDTAACALGALGGLTELCLAGCCAVTDIAITALVRAMPDLARLDLGGCHLRVGSISLFAIATLQRLQVGPPFVGVVRMCRAHPPVAQTFPAGMSITVTGADMLVRGLVQQC